VPTLVLDHASPTPKHIIDSSVIVQFLNAISDPDKKVLPPIDDLKRYDALTLEAIADGTLDATLLLRYEGVRVSPDPQYSSSIYDLL
jgi:glutathione S-transferase